MRLAGVLRPAMLLSLLAFAPLARADGASGLDASKLPPFVLLRNEKNMSIDEDGVRFMTPAERKKFLDDQAKFREQARAFGERMGAMQAERQKKAREKLIGYGVTFGVVALLWVIGAATRRE